MNQELDEAVDNLKSQLDLTDLKLALKKIHSLLKAQEDLIYILSEDQIGEIFKALEQVKETYLEVKTAAKPKKGKIDLLDLDF